MPVGNYRNNFSDEMERAFNYYDKIYELMLDFGMNNKDFTGFSCKDLHGLFSAFLLDANAPTRSPSFVSWVALRFSGHNLKDVKSAFYVDLCERKPELSAVLYEDEADASSQG